MDARTKINKEVLKNYNMDYRKYYIKIELLNTIYNFNIFFNIYKSMFIFLVFIF